MAKQRKHSKRRAVKQKKRRMAEHAREHQGGKTNDLPSGVYVEAIYPEVA